jgi:hypothetical protein
MADQPPLYREVIGNGVDGVYRVRHGLGTGNVIVEVRENAPPWGIDTTIPMVLLDAGMVELDFGGPICSASVLVLVRA